MKKKIILAGAFALLVAVGIVGVSAQKSNSELSSLLMQNIEALAEQEVWGGETTCWDTVTEKALHKTYYCGTCSWLSNSKPSTFADEESC